MCLKITLNRCCLQNTFDCNEWTLERMNRSIYFYIIWSMGHDYESMTNWINFIVLNMSRFYGFISKFTKKRLMLTVKVPCVLDDNVLFCWKPELVSVWIIQRCNTRPSKLKCKVCISMQFSLLCSYRKHYKTTSCHPAGMPYIIATTFLKVLEYCKTSFCWMEKCKLVMFSFFICS